MNQKVMSGQIWSYKNRPGEEESKLEILKVETLNNTAIAHIKIDGLNSPKNTSRARPLKSIEHMPISLEMLEKSISKLESVVNNALINEGYLYWKEEFLAGRAGIWSIEVAAAIDITDETYDQL